MNDVDFLVALTFGGALVVIVAAAIALDAASSTFAHRREDRLAREIDRLEWHRSLTGGLSLSLPDDGGELNAVRSTLLVRTQLRQVFTVSVGSGPVETLHHVLDPGIAEEVCLPGALGKTVSPRPKFFGAISAETMRHQMLPAYMARHGITCEESVTLTLDAYEMRVLVDNSSHSWVEPWAEFKPDSQLATV